VWDFYKTHKRDFPWRQTKDPYKILVSEIMLQQTQAHRVALKYQSFLKRFPTPQSLSKASLGEVLKEWQGLGYNRRAKHLHDAARYFVKEHKGNIPRDEAALRKAPGVGPYTTSAVMAFAYNEDTVMVETNIRTVFIYHFFPRKKSVSEREILEMVARTLPKGCAREWYSALMDYGAYIKSKRVRMNARVKGYAPQKPLRGSLREVRGAILKILSEKSATKHMLEKLFPTRKEEVGRALSALLGEKMIEGARGSYTLPLSRG
jgi:A/G-specific adenine glycosylase